MGYLSWSGVIAASIPALAVCVAAPVVATADVNYGWREDDGLAITGSLAVKESALGAGKITLADIQSYLFTGPGFSVSAGSLSGFQDIPINPATGAPTTLGSHFMSQSAPLAGEVSTSLTFATLDTGYATVGGELAQHSKFLPSGSVTDVGHGHWEIAGAQAPEPSAIGLLGLAITGLAGRRRRRVLAGS